jgi:hypothetical protein
MGQLPVLKPAEVVRIPLGMGFVEVRKEDLTSNSEIRKGVVLPLHFTKPGISHHHYSDRLRRILA